MTAARDASTDAEPLPGGDPSWARLFAVSAPVIQEITATVKAFNPSIQPTFDPPPLHGLADFLDGTAEAVRPPRVWMTEAGQHEALPKHTAAMEAAVRARNTREYGVALDQLRQEKGLSRGEIARRDNGKWLSKSTVSRVCNGTTLFRDGRQVAAFVDACGASEETWRWVQCWTRLHDNRPRRKTVKTDDDNAPTEVPYPAAPAVEPADEILAAALEAAADCEMSSEVLLNLNVRVTREHLRKATPMLATLGIAGVCGDTRATRSVGAAALMVAGGLALIELAQSATARAAAQEASSGALPTDNVARPQSARTLDGTPVQFIPLHGVSSPADRPKYSSLVRGRRHQ